MSNEWIGVDLDGTLAKYNGPGKCNIGRPIKLMVRRVKEWLGQGKSVRIFTARVSSTVPLHRRLDQVTSIGRWCKKHIGVELPVTAEKDNTMVELWDDRAVRVELNTGVIKSVL